MASTTPRLDFDSLASVLADGGYAGSFGLSASSALLALSAMVVIKDRFMWESQTVKLTDVEWQIVQAGIALAEDELMSNLQVGQIVPSVAVVTDPAWIIMIGQLIPQADYPALTAVVPPSWLVGADIQLPNMISTGVFGANSVPSIGQPIGANTHQLTVGEMPSHTHTQQPHTHIEQSPVVTPELLLVGPVPSTVTVPTPTPTSSTVAVNNNTGGDGAHNNVQQSLQVIWYIIAL